MSDHKNRDRKLNYSFCDPNDPAVLTDALLKILIQANKSKVEAALLKAANDGSESMDGIVDFSA